ncbi:lysophospholipid acyltransferase family protein [Streptomyces sp. NPDC019531]|uniref:lysophospholipid acyltransferase family protein n=1 Tax=Streptomyces sp. NPDC019531 TaxID=3365062 RepID=UPI003850E9DB
MTIYQTLQWTVGPLLRSLARLEISGEEFVPKSGPVVLASNHLSIVDSTFLPLALDRHITFMAKAEYFQGPGLRHRLTSAFMRGTGQVPVDRADRRAAVAALDPCLDLLRRGGAFCIYPEGTRSPDGRLYKARTGVAWLALRSGAPVVPVAMSGTDRVLPPGKVSPRPAKIRVAFGKPVDLTPFEGGADDARARRQASDTVMDAIAELSGQERAPVFATSVKN